MKSFLQKLPDPIIRLSIVFVILIGGILYVRFYIIPPSLKETGYHRTSAIEREISREIRYAGSGICADCHDEEYSMKNDGYHRNLSCETCHGPAKEHAENPSEITPPAPRERKFCPLCHTYNPSRPMGFPQINPVAHNPLDPCITCHDPHDPQPSEVPQECMACHAEISRTKAVSHHALLECTTCHRVSEGHRITPRIVRPTKLNKREFCGKCHGLDSKVKGTLKIDLFTHGEKYPCWQCHHPHLPEVR